MWMIAYKPTPASPSGRAVAMPTQFQTREAAQARIDAAKLDWMYPIETNGQIRVSYPSDK